MPNLTSDKTSFNIGDFNQSVAELPNILDFDNLYGSGEWANKVRAERDFDINDFPLRTSTRVFRISQDSVLGICSGNMIGSRYVLSVGNCITDNEENIIFNDILLCPVYNN